MKSDKTVNTEIDNSQGNTVTELLNKPVILDVPVLRGTTQITEVTVNKPNAGALRGTRLQELIETDVNSLITVLPRITSPALTANEVASLDPADLYQLSQALALFFLPSSVRSDFLNS
ncbi:phage tail assembly protein [Serratia proteamaculans]|uniref:phage tail assembly protein n=1 Tax=Serratia proteamaculans TaxID=28151 RepID=UPI0039BDD094